MSNVWVKTIQQPAGFYLNSGTGDATVGGQISSVPSGITASQGRADKPGDRMILTEADALALSDTVNVGTLYGGMYQYVTTKSGSTGTATRGRAVFWDSDTTGYQYLYQVTPDENGTIGVVPFGGVVITATITKAYSWWIQSAGRCSCMFKSSSLTGTAAIGAAAYLSAQGAGTDLGRFDCAGGDSTAVTNATLGTRLGLFVGFQHELAVAGSITTVNIPLGRSLAFRW